MKENKKLVNEIISDVKHDMSNEDIISLLADSRISANPDKEKYTFGQRAADKIAKFAGSWAFIFSFSALLILWMVGNVILAKRAFDPYPFILLNLVLSCVAALQAPLIMMSQNRQEEKDRRRAENDYKVNLKTEIMIEDIHGKMNRILARQAILMKLMKIDESTMKQITLEMQEEMCAEACKAEKEKDNHGEEKEKPES
jgi:predicted membrane protein